MNDHPRTRQQSDEAQGELERLERWNTQEPHLTALEALEHYGWSVFPLDERKHPPALGDLHPDGTPKRLAWGAYQHRRASKDTLLDWAQRFAPAAWAVITGACSGVIVLDFDGGEGARLLGRLGLSPHVRTGSGGYHVYFAHPGWPVKTLNGKAAPSLGQRWAGLDIRADGGYAAFCGRNTRGGYAWLRAPQPEPLDRLPTELRSFLGLLHAPPQQAHRITPLEAGQRRPLSSDPAALLEQAVARSEREGRNNAGFWLACQLRDRGCSQAEGAAVLLDYAQRVPPVNGKGLREVYTEEEAFASLASAYSTPAREPWQPPSVSRPPSTRRPGGGAGHRDAGGSEALSGLPEIIVGSGQLREVTSQAVEALAGVEAETPTLFVQATRLVRVGHSEVGRPILTQMGVAEVKEALTHSANYYRLKKVGRTDGPHEKVPVSPPREIAEQILARQTQRPYLPFPPLETIVEVPVMRPDGTILDRPGYDAATRLCYAPRPGMEVCRVPPAPSRSERGAALALLLEAIGEFPYAEEADLANGLGLLLTPLLRPAIRRHVPLALLDAPKPGTGKGLFADVLAIIATGTSAAVLTLSDSEEELQKSITALLLEGAAVIAIDNVSGRLQSKHLEAALTADVWRGRLLGQSKMVLVPQRATWLATGNNITLGGDLARRCYRIRLDPHTSQPWLRSGFRHDDLAGWVTEQRGALVAALLTLARAWYAADQPLAPHLPAMGTFSGWVRTIGSILAYAGVPGFLANRHRLDEELDEENAQWEGFLGSWLDLFGTAWVRIAEIIAVMDGSAGQDLAGSGLHPRAEAFFEALPDALQLVRREQPATFKIRLGKALEKRVDTCFGSANLHLERGKDEHSKVSLWRVAAGSAGGFLRSTQKA